MKLRAVLPRGDACLAARQVDNAFRSTRRPGRTLVAVLALAALLGLGQFIMGGPVEIAGDPLAAAADVYRS